MRIWLLPDKIKNIWLRGKIQWRSYQYKVYSIINKGQININERRNAKFKKCAIYNFSSISKYWIIHKYNILLYN